MSNENTGVAAAKKVAPKKKAAKKKTAAKKTGAEGAVLCRVTVKRDGFRRCGRAWEGTTEIRKGDLTTDEFEVLRNDPMFVVEVVAEAASE